MTKRSTAWCLGGRLQVLADGQEVDVGGAHVVHHLQHRLAVLAQADHDAGLGEHRRVELLHPLQQAQGVEVARAGADLGVEAGHGLEVVVEDVGLRLDDRLERRGGRI